MYQRTNDHRDVVARDLAGLRRTARVVQISGIVTTVLCALVPALPYIAPDASLLADGLDLFLLTPASIVLFTAMVGWFTRACELVANLERPPLPITKGQALVAFLVPVYNFYRPYQLFRDLDRAVDPNDVALASSGASQPPSRPAVVGLWWTSWILASVVVPVIAFVVVVMRLMAIFSDIADIDPEEKAAELATKVSEAMDGPFAVQSLALVISSALTVVVIGQIQRRIEERAARLGG